MNEPIWPDIEAFLDGLNTMDFIPATGLILNDRGALESALYRPVNLYHYENEEHTIFRYAAEYAFGLTRNHPFLDGNKRASLCSALCFLYLNGYELKASNDEIFENIISITKNQCTIQEFETWLESKSQSL